jgi:hypothetical protein
MKKKIPYENQEWSWDHIIIEGHCLWDKGRGIKDIPDFCAGQVSDKCLGKTGRMCKFFGFAHVDKKEREAMMEGWKERSLKPAKK